MTGLQRQRSLALFCVAIPAFFGLSLRSAAAQAGAAKPTKTPVDLILIVDTSATMAGKAGGRNIFPQVKRALDELVDATGPGDNVLLIPYDTDVRARATVVVYGEPDKAALHSEIDALIAKGLWTYTAAAIQHGLGEAKRLDDAQGGDKHAKVVVLLTDGMNDPPPAVRGTAAEVHLDEVARRFQGMPWFVWQIQLGPKMDAGVDGAFRSAGFPNYQPVQAAAAELNKIRADILKEVEAEKARQSAERAAAERKKLAAQAEEDARGAKEEARRREASRLRAEAEKKDREARREREEAERQAKRSQAIRMVVFGVLGLIVLGGIAAWVRARRPVPLTGKLSYWGGASSGMVDFDSEAQTEFRIGGNNGCTRTLEGCDGFELKFVTQRSGSESVCVVHSSPGDRILFQGVNTGTLQLQNEMQFGFGPYTFKYCGEGAAAASGGQSE